MLKTEEILELGFVKRPEIDWPARNIFDLKDKFSIQYCRAAKYYNPDYFPEKMCKDNYDYRYWLISNSKGDIIFKGNINSKQELEKLLEQLTLINHTK